jgi:hypothetical protein
MTENVNDHALYYFSRYINDTEFVLLFQKYQVTIMNIWIIDFTVATWELFSTDFPVLELIRLFSARECCTLGVNALNIFLISIVAQFMIDPNTCSTPLKTRNALLINSGNQTKEVIAIHFANTIKSLQKRQKATVVQLSQ